MTTFSYSVIQFQPTTRQSHIKSSAIKMSKATILIVASSLLSSVLAAEVREATQRFAIQFSGGTASELVEELERVAGKQINTLIPPRIAENPVIPPFSLKATTIDAVLLAQSEFFAESVGRWVKVEGIWVFKETVEVKVIHVGHLLGSFKYREIAESIHYAWRTDSEVYKSGGGSGYKDMITSWRWGNQSAPFTKIDWISKGSFLVLKGVPSQIRIAEAIVDTLGKQISELSSATAATKSAKQGGSVSSESAPVVSPSAPSE